MDTPNDLFQTVPCPLCGSGDCLCRRPARHPPSIDLDDLKRIFHASSHRVLMDQVVQCRSCSLLYVNPQIRPELILRGYVEAEDAEFVAQNNERIAGFRRTLGGILKRLGVNPQGLRALDVGCAAGAFLVAARELGLDAVGVEPSTWLAAWGRRAYAVNIRDGILTDGMFPERRFDLVTLWDVLEHVSQPHDMLSLIARLLRPGGSLIVSYPDAGSLAARLFGKRWPFWLSVHLLYYTPATITAQLQRAGFSPIWHQRFWMTLRWGYVARRAAPYCTLLGYLPRLMHSLRLDDLPIRYTMGQTIVVSVRRGE